MSTTRKTRKPAQSWFQRLMFAPVTLVLAAICLVAFLVPGLSSLLEFDAKQVSFGQYWRLISGHLTHFSWNHLAWDLSVFACLGYLCESRNRWLAYLTLALSALLISGLCVFHTDLDQYRGLSGLDTGLFALLNTLLLLQKHRERDWPAFALFATLLVLMFGKIVWETATSDCLFVEDAASQFTPVPFAHLAGAVVGMMLGPLESCLKPSSDERREIVVRRMMQVPRLFAPHRESERGRHLGHLPLFRVRRLSDTSSMMFEWPWAPWTTDEHVPS